MKNTALMLQAVNKLLVCIVIVFFLKTVIIII